jgi:hypothetical protein
LAAAAVAVVAIILVALAVTMVAQAAVLVGWLNKQSQWCQELLTP